MPALSNLKSKAINAVKVEQRLISDVAIEYGISRRKLYSWLSEKQPTSISRNSLKSQIKILQTEVKQLKSELKQYLITERLVDGKIILEFNKRASANTEFRKAS